MSSEKLTLIVNDEVYHWWKTARISVGIEQLAGQFELEFADKWSSQRTSLPFQKGDECKVLIDNHLVIAGWIDSIECSISGSEIVDVIRGRDYTGDLVDCSAEHSPDEWRNISLLDLARKLCAPFGISARLDADIGENFPIFKLQPGEKVFDALDRAARLRGVLLTSAKDKGLYLSSPGVGKLKTPLILGQNILEVKKTDDNSNRFSQYMIKGQQGGIELDEFPVAAKSVKARAYDRTVTRYRPLTVIAEDQANTEVAKKRAKWEATIRAARSLSLPVSVQGWISNGELWEPNYYVDVEIPRAQIKAEMLISACTYLLSENGSITNLSIVDKDAFTLRPIIRSDFQKESERKLKL